MQIEPLKLILGKHAKKERRLDNGVNKKTGDGKVKEAK